jgi:hypothetical protein
MPTTVQDPYTRLANALETVIMTEFSDIAYLRFHHDRIHESLGADGVTHVALSPEDSTASPAGTMAHDVLLQFYGPFTADVDPHQEVDPRVITTKAERLRQALRGSTNLGFEEAWFFNVLSTRFPNDATGNKSRFEMSIRFWSNDTALVETSG